MNGSEQINTTQQESINQEEKSIEKEQVDHLKETNENHETVQMKLNNEIMKLLHNIQTHHRHQTSNEQQSPLENQLNTTTKEAQVVNPSQDETTTVEEEKANVQENISSLMYVCKPEARVQPTQITPITLYDSDTQYIHGKFISTNYNYMVYGMRGNLFL